ncbi:pyridoxal-5'-phosphate-dependent protein [Ornithinimicrobium sp. CNJ-824]|uniref:DegT/DnrJ/EryC1/StrS family aminotransferase n=1 Tax=Ornithinimicrobium sp. CNJ-824 TaxID=1904966 RepID=UPI000966BB3B|nr:aminotransferase class I/II-fold pyridoxal phosphate-dependent enzyme [Ornithinimicrobium sp. CNJ-824]OLT21790.1 pyridoxal-5'-phosphate-dependent protein [Ornithinimicrobium sp. CNJ-824]
MSDRIFLSQAHVTELEEEYVLRALRSGWVAPLGPDVDAFEDEIAERVGVKHALALSSGTAALHLALLHLGARPGTVVVVPSMTFAASANAIAYTGADPVFVDSQTSDGNVDPALLIEAVDVLRSEGREVVAAMTVDLFGRTCDYERMVPALAERGVPLLEDAAEALGASSHGNQAGSFGLAATLSFNGNKIMTTSGGGMLLSDDTRLVDHCRKLSTQSREPVAWYEHAEIGYNYRLSNLLAALGRAQLTRLDEMIQRRQEIYDQYVTLLSDLPLRFLQSADHSKIDNHWLTTVVFEDDTVDVDTIVRDLGLEGIEVRHLWKPMHLQPVFGTSRFFGGAVSEGLFKNGLALPSGFRLRDQDINRVAARLREAVIA